MRWRDESLASTGRPFLPYGNGRSYGDSCLLHQGTLIDTRGLNRFIFFDPRTGHLRCESGVLLSEVLALVVPHGWFLPVTPGTAQVTVGGAIANDVHGKNHHCAGTFGHHLRSFELHRSDGRRLLCSPHDNGDWFAATVGGLGLTGLIRWAELALKPLPGSTMEWETIRFDSLETFLELSERSRDGFEYVVAWIDALTDPRALGRGLLMRGNHVADDGAAPRRPRRKPGPWITPPFSLIPRSAMQAFNWLNYHRPRRKHQRGHYQSFLFPLDALENWNRLFGRRGFYQYQCLVPRRHAVEALREILRAIVAAGQGSMLSVLKEFGEASPVGWLSFPRSGVTLALDFPDRGNETLRLLDRLDEITLAAGGAVYPAKDARMPPETFRRSYPAWQQFENYRDPNFLSDLWQRVGTSNHEGRGS